MNKLLYSAFAILLLTVVVGCHPMERGPKPGPDKQMTGTLYGAALGAGSGAVYGAQISAGTGPGVMVGAAAGATFGMISGLSQDLLEEDQIRRRDEIQRAEELTWAQEILSEHFQRRLELHPNRDIFPADLFFEADSVLLRGDAEILVSEIARLTHTRMPWSRIVVASYITSADPDSAYARFLTERRAEEIATAFVRSGVEARRVVTQAVTLPEPLLIDPYDKPDRYRQAIEVILVDR